MRKANKENIMGEVVIEDGALEASIPLLDAKAKKRASVEKQINVIKGDIEFIGRAIEDYQSRVLEQQGELVAAIEKLENMPVSKLTVEDVRTQMESIAKLPWISRVRLHTNGDLMITSKTDSLQTTFYSRIVYKGGIRVQELLPKPMTLPMPQYAFHVKLGNMGGNWGRSGNLNMRLAEPNSLKFMPNPMEVGLAQAAYAHWATTNSPWALRKDGKEHDANWSDLCLRDYEDTLKSSSKTSIVELLNSIAMFLQNAGWAHAYRTKIDWAITLGYQPYVTNLMRPLLDSESFQTIQDDTRSRLPSFLKENGITQHMFNYGALADGETSDEPIEIGRRFNDLAQEINRMHALGAHQPIMQWGHIATGSGMVSIDSLDYDEEVDEVGEPI